MPKKKKPTRKPAKKAAGRPAKKPARKPARAKAKPGPLSGARPATSGRGPTPLEIGTAVVAHLNAGEDDAPIWKRFWSPSVVSVEGGAGMAWHGRAAMEAKCSAWLAQNVVLGCRAEGPYVGCSGFAIRMTIDAEDVASGTRCSMTEVGVYTVQDGKVVREEFMGGA